MTDRQGPEPPEVRRQRIRAELQRLRAGGYIGSDPREGGVTSDLTIDEALILHSIGWQPVALVCGAGTYSIPGGLWQWGTGEILPISVAHDRAFHAGAAALEADCQSAGGHGVVGVHMDVTLNRHFVNTVFVGTAVTPIGAKAKVGRPWISDLSGRDFALLHQAGWDPSGLAYGTSFVYAPRRSAGTAIRQKGQNVELTNYTRALYSAREAAMGRMQSSAGTLSASGVVGVQISEGPIAWASHVIGFAAWGTAVGRSDRASVLPPVRATVPLDDRTRLFEATSLRTKDEA